MTGGIMMQNENREKYAEMDINQKKELIKKLRIIHPRFKKAMELIKRCHDSTSISADPQCMLITGPSGSGKSTILECYIRFHDKLIYEPTRTKKVILWAEVPSPTRITTLLETMLEQLGDPFPTRGTIGNKNHRLVNLIKDCGVELIMLDEFQHFVNTENEKVNYEVADCFKSLINRTKVPVVLFGLEKAGIVLESNKQLKRRFSMRYLLSPFGYEDENRIKEFRLLMRQMDTLLPFVNLAGLDNPDFADRIMAATGGIMNSIMKLIREAALIALEQGKDKIEITDLAKAYQLHAYIMKENDNNPFLK
jgi:energy-coupling factor transporter ATP-binding protein EcfA2